MEAASLALRRCEASQERLEKLFYELGYREPCNQVTLNSLLGWKLKRYFKRNEQMQLQASYRDAVMLFRDIVLT